MITKYKETDLSVKMVLCLVNEMSTYDYSLYQSMSSSRPFKNKAPVRAQRYIGLV